MYTHCPHCDTCFRITTEQLKAARGSVRCGRCFGTFSALEHLIDAPPPQAEQPPPALTPVVSNKPSPRPAAAKAKPAESATTQVTPQSPPKLQPREPIAEPAASPTKKAPDIIAAAPAETPTTPSPTTKVQIERSQLLVDEIQSSPRQPANNRFWRWSLLSVPFILLFIGQYAWFNLATLSQQPPLRPALEALCSIAKCEVPLIKAPYMITLVERDIRKHPKHRHVLQVSARIINKAPHPQSYPLMELSLHDITGHVIAARRFTPDEYLANTVNQKQGMVPQQVVDILLELDDPGKEAVGFEFEFL